jgi:arylformamidase
MIDITVPLRVGMEVWEGDPLFETEMVYTVEEHGANVEKLTLSAHAGSDIDALYHYFNDGSGRSTAH